jgi:hypothetical protein
MVLVPARRLKALPRTAAVSFMLRACLTVSELQWGREGCSGKNLAGAVAGPGRHPQNSRRTLLQPLRLNKGPLIASCSGQQQKAAAEMAPAFGKTGKAAAKKKALTFTIDCAKPVEDKIMEVR